jgi:hypothetical protein
VCPAAIGDPIEIGQREARSAPAPPVRHDSASNAVDVATKYADVEIQMGARSLTEKEIERPTASIHHCAVTGESQVAASVGSIEHQRPSFSFLPLRMSSTGVSTNLGPLTYS